MDDLNVEFWTDYFHWSGFGAGRTYHCRVGRLAWRIENRHGRCSAAGRLVASDE